MRNPIKPPKPTPSPTTKASLYEVIPIKFVVSGLPPELKMTELEDEMMLALRRALVDLTESVWGLKVTGVVESAKMASEQEKNAAADDGGKKKKRVRFYYDVTVLKHPTPGRRFGPIIIDALKQNYDKIMEDIEAYTQMEYFGQGGPACAVLRLCLFGNCHSF